MTAIHPRARAAEMCQSPKMAARATGLTQAEVRAIRDLKFVRWQRSLHRDPLIVARDTRPLRTPSAIAAYKARASEDAEHRARKRAAEQRREAREVAIRATLLAAAREARKLGFTVRSSKSRDGRISSYYCTREDQSLRISDHDIPWKPHREFKATMHGRDGYDGYHGDQLIIDAPRSATWLRRAITLTAAGRGIPS